MARCTSGVRAFKPLGICPSSRPPNQKPSSSARGSCINHEHSNGFRWSKLLALAPGAERSRCELLVLLGHLWRCKRSVDGSDVPHPVSELTTCPRLGEDCWSRGLQSALLLLVLGWGISHRWLLPGLMNSDSLRQRPQTIRLYTHCLRSWAGGRLWVGPPSALF
jgi:hypothetical protein